MLNPDRKKVDVVEYIYGPAERPGVTRHVVGHSEIEVVVKDGEVFVSGEITLDPEADLDSSVITAQTGQLFSTHTIHAG